MKHESVNVCISRCPDYNRERIDKALYEILEPLGGMGAFVKPGMHVLVKPNMLTDRTPDKAVTTHPALVSAVIRAASKAGGIVSFGDSPGGYFKSKQNIWDSTGFSAVARETGAELLNFEAEDPVAVSCSSKYFEPYLLAGPVAHADLVINLPKLKTHSWMVYTGAIKNILGCLPGLNKMQVHRVGTHPADFGKIIVELYSLVMPALTIMDGIWTMDERGPTNGRVRHDGLLLASDDGLALDLAVARIIGLEPESCSILSAAIKAGLSQATTDQTIFPLLDPDSVKLKDFRLPNNQWIMRIPAWLQKSVARFVSFRPEIDQNLCRMCKRCAEACPKQTISPNKDRTSMVINHENCIQCLCCQEMCTYNAVHLAPTGLMRLWASLKKRKFQKS